ncbi:P68 family surface lipoprotein [Mycoplasmopsis hyopharyngis]|uniref:P68 family surface lipoprotein n=1 Tax=Mycoplasmopsis hyopharyngis TaxID=29558 RepID=UPI0038736636
MKKNKLLVTNLALATTLGISGVVAATSVSCVREKEKIIFGVSFSRGKEQWTALEDIIQKYNNSPEHKAKKGFKEVELKNIGSGYGAAHKKIVGDIQSKNRELANITANYGATIAELVATRRYINLKDADPDASNSLDIFSEHFTGSNSKVAGLKEGGVYLLPFLKSSVVHGINGPVYKHIFKSLQEKSVQIDEQIKKMFNLDNEQWKTDVEAIKNTKNGDKSEFLGEIDENKVNELFKDKKVNYSIFENGKEFIQFLINVKKSFKNSSMPLLGIDDISGFINPLLFAALDGDESKMNASIKKNAAGEITISYENAVTNENHEAYKKSKEIFDLVKEAITAKAIKIFGDGSYASADATNHKLGSNLGSSAGYSHNFLPGVNLYNIVLKDQSLKEELREISSSSFKLTKVEGDKVFWFNQENETNTKFHNKVLKSTETGGKYDLVLDAKFDNKYEQFKTIANKNDHIMFIKKDNSELIESLKKATNEIELLAEGRQNGVEYNVYSFKTSLKTNSTSLSHYQVIAKTSDKTLQESELVAIKPFTKWESTNIKKTNFLQGPNIMGIRNNANEDRATKLFFKFLTSNKKLKFTDQTGTYEETPMEHVFRVASYVVPYKGFETASLPTNAKDNKYLNVCFDLFKEAAKGQITLYEEPASANADNFRNLVNSQYKALYTTIDSGKEGFEYKDLANEIKSNIKNFK